MKLRLLSVVSILCGFAYAALLAGCNDNDLGADKRRPNQPPQTILSSGPADSSYGATYKTSLFWSGSDPDGTIDHYDFILIDHPAANDSIAARDPNYAHLVVVRIPTADDPRWTATAAKDTIIVTSADTLRVAAPPPPPQPGDPPRDTVIQQHNEFVRRQQFQRWHTFFVRSVDNEGSVDASPEYVSFNSNTVPPTVALRLPVDPSVDQFSGPKTIIFNWDGQDPTGDGSSIDPIASRWTIQPSHKNAQGDYAGYPDSLYTLPPSQWQIWRRWDARDKSGRQAIVRNLQPADSQGHGFYLFAVQAMDEAGAVTPIFDAKTVGQNNVARVFVNDQVGPTLTVDERFLGSYQFAAGSRPVRLDVAAGQPLTFKWRGDASSYGGEIVAYRYGWNIRNPSNDEEWTQNWCLSCREAPTRAFNSGTQRFFVECRDNAESVTHAEFELVVQQVTRRRDLLFVDDTEQPQGEQVEALEDRRWKAALDSIIARADGRGQHFNFDYARDYYDVVNDHQRFPPPLSTVFDYKTVVWNTVQGGRVSAIQTLANFFDPFIERNRNAVVPFNYLSVYVDNLGEFWYTGEIPAFVIFTSMNQGAPEVEKLPANITNWDDRITPHPEQDSVGVRSFLWRFGVEMVDLGAGSRAPESRNDPIAQGCIGFRRAAPSGFEQQTFTSTPSASHTHSLAILTSDVDIPPVGGRVLETSAVQQHHHTVTLTQLDYLALARGATVVVTTDSVDVPSRHAHQFSLRDQIGLWGAPANLEPEGNVWTLPPPEVNPPGGRVNVEIYNMPTEMARQQPPLSPEPGISTVLYTYRSVTAANPNSNPPLLYPQTADGQPTVILRKFKPSSLYYSRAICSFEPWRLRQASMIALADNILLRQFRLGLPEAP